MKQLTFVFGGIALVATSTASMAQNTRPRQPQAYFALQTKRWATTETQPREPFAAMHGGFAGSSSARDVARTFGY